MDDSPRVVSVHYRGGYSKHCMQRGANITVEVAKYGGGPISVQWRDNINPLEG